ELPSLRVGHHQSSTTHHLSRRDFPLFRLRHAEEVERETQFQNVTFTFGRQEDNPGSILHVESILDALPLVKVDPNSKADLECEICIDTIEAGSQATQLPCQHLFHRDCIIHWLSNRTNTCPLCLHELQAEE
ncbi:hypothetical protein KP509_35G016200, partial [Ceratopteris richardii]